MGVVLRDLGSDGTPRHDEAIDGDAPSGARDEGIDVERLEDVPEVGRDDRGGPPQRGPPRPRRPATTPERRRASGGPSGRRSAAARHRRRAGNARRRSCNSSTRIPPAAVAPAGRTGRRARCPAPAPRREGHRRHDDDRPEAAGHLRVGGAGSSAVRMPSRTPSTSDLCVEPGIAVFRATGQPARSAATTAASSLPARAQGITQERRRQRGAPVLDLVDGLPARQPGTPSPPDLVRRRTGGEPTERARTARSSSRWRSALRILGPSRGRGCRRREGSPPPRGRSRSPGSTRPRAGRCGRTRRRDPQVALLVGLPWRVRS